MVRYPEAWHIAQSSKPRNRSALEEWAAGRRLLSG